MPTSVSSDLVYFKVSPTDVATALATGISIECAVSLSESFSSNVAEKSTMHCGTIKTVGSASISISGNGVIGGDVTATEVSAQGLKAYLTNNTRLYFAMTNITDGGTIAANEVVYMTGSGFLNSLTTNYSADELSEFDFEFAVDGAVDLTP
jgi:hypothetical protein